MSLTAKNNGGEFEKAPVGAHVARCISVVDLGTQHGEYQGTAHVSKKVWIMWELPNEKMEDGRPFGVSAFYTISLNEKANLRKDLESWRGRAFTKEELEGFNLKNILDKPCMISVIHTEKGRSKVNGVMSLPKGTPVPPRVNDIMSFDIDEWDDMVFDKIPEGIKKIIMQSDEYLGRTSDLGNGVRISVLTDEGEIPF